MRLQLLLEEFIQLLAGIVLFTFLDFSWWWFPALFLLPDIGMIGYVVNASVGAFTYNLFHHKGIAITLLILGYYLLSNELMLAGIILYSHAAFDRMLGYGLKYPDHFRHTHLHHFYEK